MKVNTKHRPPRFPTKRKPRHKFRVRSLCHAQSYQRLMEEALAEYNALPNRTATEAKWDFTRGVRGIAGGFFKEPYWRD